MADEGALRLAARVRDVGHGDDLIHNSRQFEPGLRAVDLRLEDLAVEVVEPLVEDAHEPDMLAARVLQMGQPADHLAAVQTVGAADIGLAGLLGERLGLPTAPLEAEPPGNGD